MRRAMAVPAPRIGLLGAVATTSWASSSSITSRSSSRPKAVSVLRTVSGAAVAWSSTPRSSGGMSRVAGAANCLSSAINAAAGYRSCSPYDRAGRPGHLPEEGVPEMGQPALAELPNLGNRDPQCIAGDG